MFILTIAQTLDLSNLPCKPWTISCLAVLYFSLHEKRMLHRPYLSRHYNGMCPI